MSSNFYNTNSYRSYPFIEKDHSQLDNPLSNEEILDCRFYIDNPSRTDVKVYLASRDNLTYKFRNNLPESTDLEFTRPENINDWVTIWSYNDDWYGMVVLGKPGN